MPELLKCNARLTIVNNRQIDSEAPDSWGPLKILEHLASGNTSEVYRARDTVLDRDVALKLFHTRDEDEQQRLLDEGRKLARIRHPNILQVLGANCYDGLIGFWMELVEGASLGDLLEEQGPMDAGMAIEIGRHLCAALATIHDAGLLYRDIRLENVIRVKDSGTRLMGFGPDIERGAIAPELLDGDPPSRQSDIYALGAMLGRLTGVEPESTDSDHIIATQFSDCLRKATAQNPAERYSSAEAFAKALTRAGKPPPSRVRRILGISLILLMAVFVIMQWPAQYHFDNTLYRINPDRSWTELVDGAAVGNGDNLVLEVTTTVPMYVFVFGEDERGNAWGLFPQDEASHANPLRADETHTLPAEGEDAPAWVIDEVLDLARIHVLAFPEEVPEFELLYEELPVPGDADRSTAAAAPLIETARLLDEEAEFAIGVTYRAIELGQLDN